MTVDSTLTFFVMNLQCSIVAYPQDFTDAMFAFVQYIIGSQSGGSMVVSAGIVPILLKMISNKHPSQLKASGCPCGDCTVWVL